MVSGTSRDNSFSKRTFSVLIIGMLPMFIITLFPHYFSGLNLNTSKVGVSSLRYAELSVLLNNYMRYFSPFFGVLAFLSVYRSPGLKNKFKSASKFHFYFLQYLLFVGLIYFLFYFCHLELTRSNFLIRSITNNIVGFLFFNIGIVFPALAFSLQILLIYFRLVIRELL